MSVIHLENENYSELIKEGIVVVDFFANWCGPCKMLSPIIEKIGDELPTVKFIKIDVDKHEELARKYGVMSIPTLIFIKEGVELKKHIGFITEDNIKEIIEKL